MSLTDTNTRARIAWSVIAEPGDEHVGQFINVHDDDPDKALNRIAYPGPDDAERFGLSLARWRSRLDPELLDRTVQRVAEMGLTVLTPEEQPEVFHGSLHGLAVTPHVLYVQGDAELLAPFSARRIAIVGARAATGYGDAITNDLATEAARAGFVTVSGAAYGIDRRVHESTLAAAGRTIAVLAGGLDRYYPAGNQELVRRIPERGAVVAEVPPGTSPTRDRFLKRNRIIAALGEGLVVTEAGFRSGSLNAAHEAMRAGRPIGAVPGSVFSVQSQGTHRLLDEDGAQLIRSWADVEGMLSRTLI